MDPITLSLLLSAGPAIFQGIQGIRQSSQAKDMQKKLGPRVNYQIPEEAKRALGLMENLAGSRDMPGQASMQSMMDLQSQKAFGNASRAATSSQDLLGVATSLGEQGQENQLNLGIQSAQNYQDRQKALSGALGTMAGFQDKVTADKQQDWYERANAAQEMKGAGMENTLGAMQGLSSAAMGGLQMGMDNGMLGGNKMSTSFTDPSSMPTTFKTSGLFANAPRFAGATSLASSSMPRASQGSYQPSFGFGFNRGKNPGMWDDYQPFTPKQTTPPNRYNSGFSNLDMFNPIY
jgi:hypothetical protein